MSEKRTPRDFWIEFGGDPSEDGEVYKRYSATKPFDTVFPDSEVIHCREVTEEASDTECAECEARKKKTGNELLNELLDALNETCDSIFGRKEAELTQARETVRKQAELINYLILELDHVGEGSNDCDLCAESMSDNTLIKHITDICDKALIRARLTLEEKK